MTPGVRDDGRRWSYSCFAKVHVRCAGGSCACECHVGPFIPLSLAQRILAALEKHSECGGCGLLAMDLRTRLPR